MMTSIFVNIRAYSYFSIYTNGKKIIPKATNHIFENASKRILIIEFSSLFFIKYMFSPLYKAIWEIKITIFDTFFSNFKKDKDVRDKTIIEIILMHWLISSSFLFFSNFIGRKYMTK